MFLKWWSCVTETGCQSKLCWEALKKAVAMDSGLAQSGSGCRCCSHLCRHVGLWSSTSTGFLCTSQATDLVTEGQKNLPEYFIAHPSAYYLQKKDLSDGLALEEITRCSGNDKWVVGNRCGIFFTRYWHKMCALIVVKWLFVCECVLVHVVL